MVRVVRLYTLPAYNDERTTNSIEMVFMDEHGTTMHATVRKSLVGTFEKRIKEGYVYVFAYFGIGISSGNYRTSRHEFRLNFQPRTTVTACSCERIPVHGLKLTTISEILQADSNYPYLVDTMGVLTAVGKQKEIVKESKKTKMIVIQLEADGFFGKQSLENAIIVIQYAKVKTYQVDEDFLKLTKAATIDTLKDCIEDGEYAVYGTIKDVDSDWFITVCRCGSEVVPRGGSYYCNECKRRVMNLIPRYRIKTRVVDTTDSATFVVLESVACLLLHKSCSEMLKYSENLPSGDIKPDVFNKLLIDKSYLFKVDVRHSQFNDFDPTYNVIDICFDERTISRFRERHATFFSVQIDVTLGLSTGEKSSQHTFSMGEASSCVKNLIEDFVQSKINSLND
ncbi:unnamed protein product [Cuscuta campestris]|uniref:DUF223 domain-containing protein n=1 Tax=Cuscuta campestris TaxID=132261 RepID=A0A484N5Z6_9ASTE|nr:unnamed protein product [Cuscuta campestris]